MWKKIRKGNDIGIEWSLVDEDNTPYNLEGRNVTVEITSGNLKTFRIDDVLAVQNTLMFTYWGKDQRFNGVCGLKFIENDGEKGMVTFDIPNAFELTEHSWLTADEPENDKVKLSIVSLASTLLEKVGPKGDKGDAAGFGEVTAEIDAEIGTPSVSVETSGPDTAKNFHFSFHNLRSDAEVTSQAIIAALGYTPANDESVIKQLKTFGGISIEGIGDVVQSHGAGSLIAFEHTDGNDSPFVAIIAGKGTDDSYAVLVHNKYTKLYDYGNLADGLFTSVIINSIYIELHKGNGSYNVLFLSGGNNYRVIDSPSGVPDAVDLSSNIIRYYAKPSSGIPETDLSSSVQTSLALAESALQPSQTVEVTQENPYIRITITEDTGTVIFSSDNRLLLVQKYGSCDYVAVDLYGTSSAGVLLGRDQSFYVAGGNTNRVLFRNCTGTVASSPVPAGQFFIRIIQKVTAISNRSTDDEYPSAKAVYDALPTALSTSEIDTIWDNA